MVLILIGATLIIIGYLNNRKKTLNMIDILILSNLLFFGIYPISDILNENYNHNWEIFLFSIIFIASSLFFLKLAFKLFPKFYLNSLSLSSALKKASNISRKYTLLFFLISVFIISYFFLKYNLIFRVINENNPELVNFYSKTIFTTVYPINYLLTIILSQKIFKKTNHNNTFNFLLLLLISCYWLFYGRREFIFHILIIGLIWFNTNNKKLISFKNIFLALIASVIVLIGSNLYQNLRYDIMLFSVTGEFKPSKNLLESAFDFQSTQKNLGDRNSALPLLGTVIKKVEENNLSSNGTIFLAGIQNSIPSILYSKKSYSNDDELIAKNLKIPYTDYSTNLYLSFYSDFGFLSLIILPITLIFYYGIVALFLYLTKNNAIIFLLIFVLSLTYTLNVETTITSIFNSLRAILILFILHLFFSSFLKNNNLTFKP